MPVEWAFETGTLYGDPWMDVSLDVESPTRRELSSWCPPTGPGTTTWKVIWVPCSRALRLPRSVCSDTANAGLHGQTGTIDITDYDGDNPLYRHGPIARRTNGISSTRTGRHSSGSGTPGGSVCAGVGWPDGFQALTRTGSGRVSTSSDHHRAQPGGHRRGHLTLRPSQLQRSGIPWEDDYARIDPAYWDLADIRIAHLVENGLVPCLVGSWGYHLPPWAWSGWSSTGGT